jgi:hypothetical protein
MLQRECLSKDMIGRCREIDIVICPTDKGHKKGGVKMAIWFVMMIVLVICLCGCYPFTEETEELQSPADARLQKWEMESKRWKHLLKQLR